MVYQCNLQRIPHAKLLPRRQSLQRTLNPSEFPPTHPAPGGTPEYWIGIDVEKCYVEVSSNREDTNSTFSPQLEMFPKKPRRKWEKTDVAPKAIVMIARYDQKILFRADTTGVAEVQEPRFGSRNVMWMIDKVASED